MRYQALLLGLACLAVTSLMGNVAQAQQCVNPNQFDKCVEAKKLMMTLEQQPHNLSDTEMGLLQQCPQLSPDTNPTGQCVDNKKFETCVQAKRLADTIRQYHIAQPSPEYKAVLNQCPEVVGTLTPTTTTYVKPPKGRIKRGFGILGGLLLEAAPMIIPMIDGGGSAPCTGH